MKRPQEIKHIAETLYGYMDVAYDEGFEAGVKTTQECSWEKGVRDAWEYIKHMALDNGCTFDYPSEEWDFAKFLIDLDPVMYTKDYVEERNRKDLAKTEPIEVGDIVIQPDGEERLVTQVVGDFIYIFDYKNGTDLRVCTRNELTKTGKKAVVKTFKPLAVGELK